MTTAPVITIFVRHAAGCKYATNETARRCNCRKHFRWFDGSAQQRRSSGTRLWAEAEQLKRKLEDQLAGRVTVEPTRSIDEAVQLFKQAKMLEGVSGSRLRACATQLRRFVSYAHSKGVFMLAGLTPELFTKYCATWKTRSSSSVQYLKMLSSFLNYCHEAGWIQRKVKLPHIQVDTATTEPLTPEEYTRLLAAATNPKVHALIQLMRYSGLAVGDASTLERAEIRDTRDFYRVTTARHKTGMHVSVPIPRAIGDEILSVAGDTYLFFTCRGNGVGFAHFSGRQISAAFARAGLLNGGHMKSHRLRDTFAVELLSKGVPMEEVSKLLGHDSILTTEKHYAKWVKSRQDRLDSLVTATWAT
jgi:integrase/recombinase XerD